MIQAGFIDDIAALPKEYNGFELNLLRVSQKIINHFVVSIEVLLLIKAVSTINISLGFVIASLKKRIRHIFLLSSISFTIDSSN